MSFLNNFIGCKQAKLFWLLAIFIILAILVITLIKLIFKFSFGSLIYAFITFLVSIIIAIIVSFLITLSCQKLGDTPAWIITLVCMLLLLLGLAGYATGIVFV